MRATLPPAFALCLFSLAPCQANSSSGAAPFLNCATIEAPEQRLACFDAAVASTQDDRVTAVRAVPEEPVKAPGATRREPDVTEPPVRGVRTNSAPEPQRERYQTTAKVTRVWKTPRGGVGVDLDNGQSWAQAETKTFIIRAGKDVQVTEYMLGGYRMSIDGSNRSTLVTRVR